MSYERFAMRTQLKLESYKDLTLSERFALIRKAYDYYMPSIMNGPISPYFLEWKWSPIEFAMWCDIRRIGLPFYPQFPVLNYFLDFADPVKKIAIECDGKQWHQDIEKDKARDKRIEALGWQIFRVPGHMCYVTQEAFLEKEGEDTSLSFHRWFDDRHKCYSTNDHHTDHLFERWALRSSEGLMLKLREEYYWLPKEKKGYESPFTADYFNSNH